MRYLLPTHASATWLGWVGLAITVSVGCIGCDHKSAPAGRRVDSVAVTANVSSVSGWVGLVEQPAHQAPSSGISALLGTDSVVLAPDSDRSKLLVCEMDSGAILASWELGPEWFVSRMSRSRKGGFVAIYVSEELTVTGNFSLESCKIAIVGPPKDIRWVGPVRFTSEGVGSSPAIVSDDGQLVAILGIGGANELEVWSVKDNRLLWQDIPQGESALRDIAFSPDGKDIYAGGTSGWVYGYKVDSGQVAARCLASKGKTPAYGHRVSRIDVSPDGTMLAAGTGPGGDVFVFSVQTGRRVRVIMP